MRQIVGQSFNKGGQGVPEDLEGAGNQALQNNAVRELAIDLKSLSKYTETLRSGGGNQSTVKVEIEKKLSEIEKKVAELERVKSTLEQRERAEFDRMKSEFVKAKERLRAP
jgi:phage shock protein A